VPAPEIHYPYISQDLRPVLRPATRAWAELARPVPYKKSDSARPAANGGTARLPEDLRAERVTIMRLSLRSMALAGVLATGLLDLGTTPAKAQGYGGGYYGGGGYYTVADPVLPSMQYDGWCSP